MTVEDSRVHKQCLADDVEVYCVDSQQKSATFDFLKQQHVDLVFSAGFPYIFPPDILTSGPVYVNSHPALLPAYKGYHAIRNAFAAHEEFMGVTVHLMEAEVDTGEQLVQERVRVGGLSLEQVFELLFSVVEPLAITRALEKLLVGDETA